MKKQKAVWVSVLTLGLFASYAWGGPGHHEHGGKEAASHQPSHGSAASGQAGKAANVSRTIKINALDTMRFELKDAEVKAGETIRFVVTNLGKIRHELAIGTREEQLQHAKMMASMPGMKHEDDNAVTLEPGETRELVWQFGKAGVLELACHLPGHYEAGMHARMTIKK